MRIRLIAVALAAGLALLAAGCSSAKTASGPSTEPIVSASTPSGGGQQSATPDPCQLLTLAEVSAQMGEEFTVVKELPMGGLPGQRTCSYQKAPDSLDTVSVGVWPFDPANLDAFMAQAGNVDQFDGLGDRAFGEPRSLWILKGHTMVNIVIISVDVTNVDPILQLGAKAVGRL